ncbi:MAG: glycosyltransferase [Deltaproteobacteria bacterium]|nr:glycosyltransferase [Deltaproteobacteria bacterium]
MEYDVITICLNSETTLQRSIDSVLKQRATPARYIFVDGGSTDRTLSIIRSSMSENPRIDWVLLRQGGRGIPNAWNMGLKHARSDLVCILNSDDWYPEDTIYRVMGLFGNNPHAQIVAGAIRLFPRQSMSPTRIIGLRPLKLIPFLMPIMHPACFVRRPVYERIGAFDERYLISADYDFIYRCYRSGISFLTCKIPLTNMQAGGLALGNRKKARLETLQIGRRHCPIGVLPYLAYLVRLALNL